MSEEFKKADEGKLDWSLFPFDGAEGIVRILMFGANKYGRNNWRGGAHDEEAKRRLFAGILRHLTAMQRGQIYDPESGQAHVYHAACGCLFLASFEAMSRTSQTSGSSTVHSAPPPGSQSAGWDAS